MGKRKVVYSKNLSKATGYPFQEGSKKVIEGADETNKKLETQNESTISDPSNNGVTPA